MHEPYEIKFNHPADFRVKYRFLKEKEGGRSTTPTQGYRSDFWYYHEEQPDPKSIYMIWPEFENKKGDVIIDTVRNITRQGTARMWILFPKMRKFHQNKIKVGLQGYFMEGQRRVAECEVIEIIGLNINSIEE